ncbi:unnamed protein product [Closterium sp. NIES-64]|nr:unnamed protein product [Closterium sp. NIES-64]
MACTSGMSLRAMEKSLIASNGFLRSSGTVSHRLVTSAPLPRQRVSRLVTEAKVREIFMPALSSTMTEGKIVAWSKSEGETVSKGESVVVVESDKADMDVETFYDGIIATILVGEGEVAPVGKVVATPEAKKLAKKHKVRCNGSLLCPLHAARLFLSPSFTPSPPSPSAPPFHQVDLAKVAGSGPYGRITPDDIKKAAGIATAPAPTIIAPAPAAAAAAPAARTWRPRSLCPPSVLVTPLPPDALDALYKRVKGKGVTMTALLAKAVGMALARHPIVNAACKDGKSFHYNESVNVAVAVAMDGGLITPVLKNADETDLFTMSGQWKELVGKARRKALSPGDYSGGTFTLSNLGMFGVDRFDAILPIGQGAIMAVGSSIPTMVAAEDGSFGIKRQMQVNVTADHRIIYGADLAEFLQTFAKIVEDPDQLTL